jgi:hypothetical protein
MRQCCAAGIKARGGNTSIKCPISLFFPNLNFFIFLFSSFLWCVRIIVVYYFYKSTLLILYSSKCCNWKYILAQKHVFSLYAIILAGSVLHVKAIFIFFVTTALKIFD